MKAPFLIGRMMFGGYFIYAGINHFMNTEALAQYAGAKNVPKPDVMVKVTGGMMIAGGTSILLGIQPKLGAAALIGFLGGVSPMMHDFWRKEDPAQRQTEMINFTKNMALLGGALTMMGVEEPWEASVPIAQPKPLNGKAAKNKVQKFVRWAKAA